MRKKTDSLVITFSATTDAMAAEKYLMGRQLPGRLIPLPSEIDAGCGLAWKAPVETEELLRRELDAAGLSWDVMLVIAI